MSPFRRPAVFLTGLILLSVLACNLGPLAVDPNAASTAVAGTISAGQTSTAAVLSAAGTLAASAIPPTAAATETPEFTVTPSDTATPVPTATPEASATPAVPMASLTQNTNCRGGPLAVYDLIRTFLTGEAAQITGKNAAGDYWYVTDPGQPGKDCWLWGRYVTVSGDTSNVPVFTPPPTPTPAYVWSGDWNVWVNSSQGAMSLHQSTNSVTGTLELNGQSFDLNGSTSDGGRTFSGKVTSSTPQIPIVFRMTSSMDQFTGHFVQSGQSYPWCGARNGAGEPSPCQGP